MSNPCLISADTPKGHCCRSPQRAKAITLHRVPPMRNLGRFYIEEMCMLEVPEHLEQYIDYEACGVTDIMQEESRERTPQKSRGMEL